MPKVKEKLSKFWSFNHETKWSQVGKPYFACVEEIEFFKDKLGYDSEPEIVMGDEFNFVAVFEHPEREEYLFHMEIEDFVKIFFADSLPAMFYVLEQANYIINGHFRTVKLLESIKDG